jgi:cytochrome bd ubiquinol oxidase subunit II
MSADLILAGIMLAALVIYSELAGADYGAGFWDLMCSGSRQEEHRALIAQCGRQTIFGSF